MKSKEYIRPIRIFELQEELDYVKRIKSKIKDFCPKNKGSG
ncbi:hypothetical protein HNR27_003078 [Ornithinibacillus bavariensis]